MQTSLSFSLWVELNLCCFFSASNALAIRALHPWIYIAIVSNHHVKERTIFITGTLEIIRRKLLSAVAISHCAPIHFKFSATYFHFSSNVLSLRYCHTFTWRRHFLRDSLPFFQLHPAISVMRLYDDCSFLNFNSDYLCNGEMYRIFHILKSNILTDKP